MEKSVEVQEKIEEYRRVRKENAKQLLGPVFGPAPTPEVFTTKWLHKSTDFINNTNTELFDPHAIQSVSGPERLRAAFEFVLAFWQEYKLLAQINPDQFDFKVFEHGIESTLNDPKAIKVKPTQGVFRTVLVQISIVEGFVNTSCLVWKKCEDPYDDHPIVSSHKMTEMDKERYRDEARDCFARVLEAEKAGAWKIWSSGLEDRVYHGFPSSNSKTASSRQGMRKEW